MYFLGKLKRTMRSNYSIINILLNIY